MHYAQSVIRQGYNWVVDCDLEAFFDHVNHDLLMTQLKAHHDDDKLLRLINRYLKAGVCINGIKQASVKGVPQGGPLSPVLSNIVQTLFKHCSNIVQTLFKHCSNIVQTLFKHCAEQSGLGTGKA